MPLVLMIRDATFAAMTRRWNNRRPARREGRPRAPTRGNFFVKCPLFHDRGVISRYPRNTFPSRKPLRSFRSTKAPRHSSTPLA